VGPTRAAQLPVGSASVDSADCANAPVPLQDLLAKVARVGAEAPFVNTPIRAERKTPRRDFETTPAAEGSPVAPFRQGCSISEAARDCSRSAQLVHNIFRIKCFGRFCPASSGWRALLRCSQQTRRVICFSDSLPRRHSFEIDLSLQRSGVIQGLVSYGVAIPPRIASGEAVAGGRIDHYGRSTP
jgi:hypothetical protein